MAKKINIEKSKNILRGKEAADWIAKNQGKKEFQILDADGTVLQKQERKRQLLDKISSSLLDPVLSTAELAAEGILNQSQKGKQDAVFLTQNEWDEWNQDPLHTIGKGTQLAAKWGQFAVPMGGKYGYFLPGAASGALGSYGGQDDISNIKVDEIAKDAAIGGALSWGMHKLFPGSDKGAKKATEKSTEKLGSESNFIEDAGKDVDDSFTRKFVKSDRWGRDVGRTTHNPVTGVETTVDQAKRDMFRKITGTTTTPRGIEEKIANYADEVSDRFNQEVTSKSVDFNKDAVFDDIINKIKKQPGGAELLRNPDNPLMPFAEELAAANGTDPGQLRKIVDHVQETLGSGYFKGRDLDQATKTAAQALDTFQQGINNELKNQLPELKNILSEMSLMYQLKRSVAQGLNKSTQGGIKLGSLLTIPDFGVTNKLKRVVGQGLMEVGGGIGNIPGMNQISGLIGNNAPTLSKLLIGGQVPQNVADIVLSENKQNDQSVSDGSQGGSYTSLIESPLGNRLMAAAKNSENMANEMYQLGFKDSDIKHAIEQAVGKELPASETKELQELTEALGTVDQMQALIEQGDSHFGGVRELPGVSSVIGSFDKERGLLKSQYDLSERKLLEALTGESVSAKDQKAYASMYGLPSVSTNPQQARQQLMAIAQEVANKYNEKIRLYQRNNYNPFLTAF